ncbi:PAS-domain containing protein, partial [Albidovulum sp.]
EIEQTIFLFDGTELVDATGPARRLLDGIEPHGNEWERLRGFLCARLPGIGDRLDSLAQSGRFETGPRDGLSVLAETVGSMTRITLTDAQAEGQGVIVDALSQRAQEEEIRALREMLALAPEPIWRSDGEGRIAWANRAYLDLAARRRGVPPDELTWPLPELFAPIPAGAAARDRRQEVETGPDGKAAWFELHSVPAGPGAVNYAHSADAVVKAERALGDFVQTLTKTFAQLPLGLAIFDRDRLLALFNPSLVDLTRLEAEFLSSRPTLFAFLDRLRERHIIPEPKNYREWRQEMATLERAATEGHYEETWTLPTGQTYRVTGRPHPNGAIAFLFEDITSEVSLTRHFRSEIELGQAVVDTLEEAIAVFSPAGELLFSNRAYDRLWRVETNTTLGTVTVTDATRHWASMTRPTPVWGDVRDFVGEIGERAEWTAEVMLDSGQWLHCRFLPLPGGRTMIGFTRSEKSDRGERKPVAVSADCGTAGM